MAPKHTNFKGWQAQTVHRFELLPGVGAIPIRLSATRSSIKQQLTELGLPSGATIGKVDYYLSNVVQVVFDATDRSSFIGIAASLDVELIYAGQNILDLPARAAFELIAVHEGGEVPPYNTNELHFPNQVITLWEADVQYDRRNRQVPKWAQIGIGNSEYLAAIRHKPI